ncbi:MAG: methionine--tRNA ligase [Phycisphaerales bacterium]|nr:methionine--tRNA ligase [Phycisphaerales bacterium]
MPEPFYITTPIYYVNDKPHIGHCYSTLVADSVARFMRLAGRDVFFLTGTDEHSERVASAAVERSLTPIQWADDNAAAFKEAFAWMGFSNDDFIRTTESRHIDRVKQYIRTLMDKGDVVLGEYAGWWDHSQEEYLTETVARDAEYKSPVTGKPLVKRTEKNYFFKLSAYQDKLLAHIEAHPEFIRPEARRNEVLGRLRDGLQDVPISRAAPAEGAWGITMPDDLSHVVYVWIDALFNYMSTVDTDDRRTYWPAQVHVLAKDILWFHAVIWPCLLMALGKPLPECVYAHSFWIREGRKMSKSLGNFVDMPTVHAYADRFSIDGVRWYLLTQGPLGATDADFTYSKFLEVYNADLANGFGNAVSRVTNMIAKYFDGVVPEPEGGAGANLGIDWPALVKEKSGEARAAWARVDIGGALHAAMTVSRAVDQFVNDTAPFKLAKDPANLPKVGTILYQCAEALRIAAYLLSPAMPTSMCDAIGRLGYAPEGTPSYDTLMTWGQLAPGSTVRKGDALFPRADADADPPVATPETAGSP